MDLMWLNGYHATSVKDIVSASGIPKGSFYNYFESKESFAKEALKLYMTEGEEIVNDTLANEHLAPLERLKRFYKRRIDHMERQMQLKKGCFASNMASELGDTNDDLSKVIQEVLDELKVPIKEAVRLAQIDGSIQSVADPSEITDFMENSFRGAFMEMKSSRSAEPLRNCNKFIFSAILV